MKDYLIITLLIVILMILFSRRQSSYTQSELGMLTPAISQSVATLVAGDIIDIIINQTKGLPVLSSVNSLINKVNAAESSAQLVPYTSEAQISNMFQTAYNNGESSLTRTDQAILRFVTLFAIEIQGFPWGSGGLPVISFTTDGKPVWADEVLGQSGLSIHDGIIKVMEIAKKLKNIDASFLDDINSLLPSNLTKFTSLNDYANRFPSMTDPSIVWVVKFVSIGPLYMVWVAENKWRINLSWRLAQEAAPTRVT
jgi:hypothetical protein